MKFSRQSGSASTKKSSTKFGKSRTQANVAGYEKRKAQKAKSATTTSDLYEHIPEKSRRSKVNLDLDRNEAMEYGTGIDGASEEEREGLRARLIGEGMDDEEIASEDDEEIDSDAAFEESDEERFAGFFSSKVSLACELLTILECSFENRNLNLRRSKNLKLLCGLQRLTLTRMKTKTYDQTAVMTATKRRRRKETTTNLSTCSTFSTGKAT